MDSQRLNLVPELSQVAKKVLAYYELHSRDSYTEIAQAVKVSEQLVKYHIHRAKEEGLIMQSTAVLDPAVLGYPMYIIFLRFLGVSTTEEQRWLEKCTKVPGVMVVGLSFARWNGVVAVWAKNPDELENRLADITKTIGGKIAEMQVTTRLHCHYGSTSILSDKYPTVFHSSEKLDEHFKIDAKDLVILKALSIDARLSAAKIGLEAELSPTAVQSRIKKLEENKIIIGYRALFDYSRFGFTQFRVLLRLAEPTPSIFKKIMKELFDTGRVIIVSRHLGFSDVDVRCYARSLNELSAMLAELRDKFVDDIVQVEVVPLLLWRFVSHLPIMQSD